MTIEEAIEAAQAVEDWREHWLAKAEDERGRIHVDRSANHRAAEVLRKIRPAMEEWRNT